MSNHLLHFTVINKNVLSLEYIIFIKPLFITSFISHWKELGTVAPSLLLLHYISSICSKVLTWILIYNGTIQTISSVYKLYLYNIWKASFWGGILHGCFFNHWQTITIGNFLNVFVSVLWKPYTSYYLYNYLPGPEHVHSGDGRKQKQQTPEQKSWGQTEWTTNSEQDATTATRSSQYLQWTTLSRTMQVS